jgi:hypothetical protein
MQDFPGLAGGATPANQTTSTLGFQSPGVNLFSGQPTSGGGLYGSTGTSLFETASAGQPESITGGLSSGYLGRSPSQAPLSNTGQPGTAAPNVSFPTGPLGSSSGNAFSYLGAPGSLETLGGTPQGNQGNLMGAPMQQYENFQGQPQVIEGSGGGNTSGPDVSGTGPSFQGPVTAGLSTPFGVFGGNLPGQESSRGFVGQMTDQALGALFGQAPNVTVPGIGRTATFGTAANTAMNFAPNPASLVNSLLGMGMTNFQAQQAADSINRGVSYDLAFAGLPSGETPQAPITAFPNQFAASTGGGFRAGGLSYYSGLPAGPTPRGAVDEPTNVDVTPPDVPGGLIGLDPTGQDIGQGGLIGLDPTGQDTTGQGPGPGTSAPGIGAVSGPGPGTPGNPSGEEGGPGGGGGGAGDGGASLLCNFCLGAGTGDAGETAAQRRAFDGLAKRAFAANPALKRSFVHYQQASRAIIARLEKLPPEQKHAALKDLRESLVKPFYAAAQQRDVRGAARVLRSVTLRLADSYGVPVPKEHILASENHLGPVHAR